MIPLTLESRDTPLALDLTVPRICLCVADHNPNVLQLHVHHIWPLGEGGPKEKWNEVYSCPSMHSNIHFVLLAMLKGQPNSMRNLYARELIETGYKAILEARDG